jgi:hypothetical protein
VKTAIIAIVVCVSLAAGCASRSQVNASSNTAAGGISQPPAGTTVTSGSAGLRAQTAGSNSIAAALIAIGLLSAAAPPSERAPELAADRLVNEQDCTRPLEPSTGNLRCK